MRRGFTLIELLAVIVILAIIALIATPIVLNIINDTKESAILRSADFYIDAVEYLLAKRVLDGKSINDGTYNIMESGNICIGTLEDNTCNGEILEVEVDGERPNGDKITIKDGQIVSHVIKYGDVVVNPDGTTEIVTPGSGSESDDDLNNENVIPEGGTYIVGREFNSEEWCYDYTNATTYNAGDKFPVIQKGDVYLFGNYEYCYGYNIDDEIGIYNGSTEGWGVLCLKDVADPGPILESINGEPITSVSYAFHGNTELTVAPAIPETVTNMAGTFWGCESLTEAPVIPSNVTNMFGTFRECSSLAGSITINATPADYEQCLMCTQITEILGSCENKDEILGTCEEL